MSKTKNEQVSTDLVITVAPRVPAPEPAALARTFFRDTVFTSRTVVLPGGTTVAVAQGIVSVDPADVEALDYLKAHAEFEALE